MITLLSISGCVTSPGPSKLELPDTHKVKTRKIIKCFVVCRFQLQFTGNLAECLFLYSEVLQYFFIVRYLC